MICYNRSMSNDTEQIQAIRALADEIPLNDFGLPTGIYRTDLLPYHDYVAPHKVNIHDDPADPAELELLPLLGEGEEEGEDVTDAFNRDLTSLTTDTHHGSSEQSVYRIAGFPAEHLHHAFMPLQFDEGFPAFDNGRPFWGRLEFEPADAYEAFQKYLQMSLGRASTLEGSGEDEEYDGKSASGMRDISALASDICPQDSKLLQLIQRFQEYYHLYYWGMRSHAYDLCRVAQHRTMQEARAIESQDEHYVVSRRLRHRLMQYMDDDEDFWDMMTPKTGLDMFKTLTQLERVSAGLPAAGPGGPGGRNSNIEEHGKPFEVTLRTVAQTNRRITNVSESDEDNVLNRALEDPESTEILQKLIITSGGY